MVDKLFGLVLFLAILGWYIWDCRQIAIAQRGNLRRTLIGLRATLQVPFSRHMWALFWCRDPYLIYRDELV
jgi:hypothetical protein